ncbi:MAG: endonuclease/exonuclease/phosphatase family protein [Weeksellaceae bacterium]
MKYLINLLIFSLCYLVYSQNTIDVMSFNIRMDSPNDGINKWSNRKDWVANLINYREIDILGTQEVTYSQLTDLKDLLPHYNAIGIGREGGTKGEHNPIFYNKYRFKILNSKTIWLSENTMDTASIGWDARLPRIVTYAKLLDKLNKRELFVFNTHFDHIGKIARLKSAELIINLVHEIAKDKPAIIMGDLNSDMDSEVYQKLINNLHNSAVEAPIKYGVPFTFNAWDYEMNKDYKTIDYIFYNSDEISPSKHEVIDIQRGKLFASDHYPIYAQFRYTGEVSKNKPYESHRIISYNIHHGLSPGLASQSINMLSVANILKKNNPDVVCLQELDVNTFRSGKNLNQLESIANKLNMDKFYGKTIDYDGGDYGIGLLSKLPIESAEFIPLPNQKSFEPRGIIIAKLKTDNKILSVACTHLSSESNQSRKNQIDYIRQNYKGYIIMGDLNATKDEDIFDGFNNYNFLPTNQSTYPSDNPTIQIDYFIVPDNYTIIDSGVINDYGISDHRPIFLDLKK